MFGLLFLFARNRKELLHTIARQIGVGVYFLGCLPQYLKLRRNGQTINNGKGYNLPPRVTGAEMVEGLEKYGLTGLFELFKVQRAKLGPIFTVMTPNAPIILVSDPSAVETVMTDRTFFPSRPDSLGFRTFIPLGLLGLPTNQMWNTHRRLLSKGFAEPAMKIHCSTIADELIVLLDHFSRYAEQLKLSGITAETMQPIHVAGREKFKLDLNVVKKILGLNSDKAGVFTQEEEEEMRTSVYRFGQGTIDVHEELTRLTFDIIGKIAFGVKFATLTDRASPSFLAGDILITEAAQRSSQPPIAWSFPPGRMEQFLWARNYARDLVKGTIATIEAESTPELKAKLSTSRNPMIEGNMVQAMLSAAQEEGDKKAAAAATSSGSGSGSGALKVPSKIASRLQNNAGENRMISDEEVIQEALTLLGAGHETTSNTVSSSLLLLCQYPKWQEWLREECVAILSPSGNPKAPFLPPNFTQWRKMERTQAVIMEALRLFPTVPMFPRLVEKDTTLMGYDLPRDSWVFVHQYGLNSSTQLWGEDAAEFRPDRFLVKGGAPLSGFTHGIPQSSDAETTADDKRKFSWSFLPFGAGPRSCLGRRLALMESVSILSSVIANFSFELPKGVTLHSVPLKGDITLGHKFGLPLLLKSSGAVPPAAASKTVKKKPVAISAASSTPSL